MPFSATSTQYSGRHNQSNWGGGSIQIGKVEVKLSLFIDYMILYIKYPKDYTKKKLFE